MAGELGHRVAPSVYRFLTFAAASTVLGPTLLLNLRKMAEGDAIKGRCTAYFYVFLTANADRRP